MQDDFLQQLEYAGFTARIKRLSDQLLSSARKVYQYEQIDIEPNWHLVFLLLKKEGKLTVTEMAQKLRFSHPAVIKIVKKMKDHGYLSSLADKQDSRKQLIGLTAKSKRLLPSLEERWNVIQETIQGFVTQETMAELKRLEEQLNEKALHERFISNTNAK